MTDTKEETTNIDSIWKEMEENDRKVREMYRKKIKGRTSLNALTAPRSKCKTKLKAKKTYRFCKVSKPKGQTKADERENDAQVTIQQDKHTLIRKLPDA